MEGFVSTLAVRALWKCRQYQGRYKMDPFDGEFDAKDAAIIGGIMGFAEESMREENRQPDEVEEDVDMPSGGDVDVTMRLLRNENPGLFDYVVKAVLKHKRQWAKDRREREQHMRDMAEVGHELEAMARTERMLEESDEG